MRFVTLSLLLPLAACGPFPKDLEGTSERIAESRTIRVGEADFHRQDVGDAKRLLARLGQVSGAKVALDTGSAERQIARLEAGELDLVIGEFAEDSPWLADVTLIEPISTRTVGERKVGLHALAANGENRWIATVEKAVRDLETVP